MLEQRVREKLFFYRKLSHKVRPTILQHDNILENMFIYFLAKNYQEN